MKNKLAALLVALLVCLSLHPSQTFAASETNLSDPLIVSENAEPGASESSGEPASLEFPISQWLAIQSEEGPELTGNEH